MQIRRTALLGLQGFILASAAIIISTAIINWKMTYKRANILNKVIIFIWICIMYLYTFFGLYERREIMDAVLYSFILLLIKSLMVIVMTYIPYIRNKEDSQIVKNTIRDSFFYCVFDIIIFSFIIFEIFRWHI